MIFAGCVTTHISPVPIIPPVTEKPPVIIVPPVKKYVYLKPSNTIIVVQQNYDYSCKYLYKWFNKIAGTEPFSNQNFGVKREVTELGDTTGKMVISVGDTKYNSSINVTGNAAFVIKKSGNLISIKGADMFGNYAGVRYFLDNYCGTRMYLPNDLFTSRQSSDSIFVPDSINVSDRPDVPNVFATGFNYKAYGSAGDLSQWDNYWAWLNGLNRNFIPEHQHTFSTRFFDSVVFMNYVRIFSNGYFPTSTQDQAFTPDFAEPSLVDAAEYASLKYFKANPNSQSIAFSVMDGAFNVGPSTKLFAANYSDPLQGYADANAIFLNNLAARLRKDSLGSKKIVYIAYSGVRYPPTIVLDSMILPVLVYHVAELYDEDMDINNPAVIAWNKATDKVGEHDWSQGMGYIYPRIYTANVSKFCKLLSTLGKLDFYDIEAYPNWALEGPKFYEMSKILWNINVNTDSIRMQFCNDMFGNASTEMYLYFNALEYLNKTNISQSHLFNYREQLQGTDSAIMVMLRNYLNNALMADTSAIVQQRINYFNTGFKIYEGGWQVKQGADTTNYANFLRSIAGRGDMYFMAGDSATFINNIPAFIKSLQ